MAYIFQTRTDGLGHALRSETAKLQQQVAHAEAIAANGVPGYQPEHDDDGGEIATTLDTLPLLVRYELTFDGTDEIAEVTEVSIHGHVIQAQDFAADIRAEWARECMRSRGAQ